jgi:hypothetical protein
LEELAIVTREDSRRFGRERQESVARRFGRERMLSPGWALDTLPVFLGV